MECTDFRPSILRILDTSQAICSDSEPLCSFLSDEPRLRVYSAAEAHDDYWNSSPLQMNGGFQFMSEHTELSYNLSSILLDAFHLTELRLTRSADASSSNSQQYPDRSTMIGSVHSRLEHFSAVKPAPQRPGHSSPHRVLSFDGLDTLPRLRRRHPSPRPRQRTRCQDVSVDHAQGLPRALGCVCHTCTCGCKSPFFLH